MCDDDRGPYDPTDEFCECDDDDGEELLERFDEPPDDPRLRANWIQAKARKAGKSTHFHFRGTSTMQRTGARIDRHLRKVSND